ncbi:MAG: serine/threonine-protein kinase [Myxococcota bacterium]
MAERGLEVGGAAPEAGAIVGGRYRIVRLLGIGGMGRVFVAENLRTGRHLALKWVSLVDDNDGRAARFAREARMAGRIQHPNVVDVYDVIEDGGATYLVMELLEGEPLSALLEREGHLPPADAAALMIEVLRGVAAIHDAGVIHRDLKPDNLFLCRGTTNSPPVVKVLDFGVSKVVGPEELSLTKTGAVVGTPYYMAPEQIRGVKELDHRVDLYAIGAILYECLTGRLPFDGDSYGALAIQIATTSPRPFAEVASWVDVTFGDVVMRAMVREPSERFSSAADLARALEPFAGGVQFEEGRADWTGRIGVGSSSNSMFPSQLATTEAEAPRSSSRRWWVLSIVVLIFVASVALGMSWRGAAPDVPVETPTAATPPVEPASPSTLVQTTDPEAETETAETEAAETETAETETAETEAAQTAETATPADLEANPAEMATEPERTSMRRVRDRRGRSRGHRAGEISLDDF